MSRKMYKYRKNEMIGGVCAGIADYFGIDVTLVRLGMVVFGLLWGTGILFYIAAMVIMPDKSELTGSNEKKD